MTVYAIETDLVLDQEGNSDQSIIDDFSLPLAAMSGDSIQVGGAAPVFTKIADKNQMMADLADGTIKFAFGSANRLPTGSDEFLFAHLFGMEIQEYLAWYYAGGGEAHIDAQVLSLGSPNDAVMHFPIAARGPESGCWAKEAITYKKMVDGLWSDGTQINMRLADEAKPAHLLAFPNVPTPATTPTVSFLGDIINGTFSAAEFNEPVGDAASENNLFPNYPAVGGSVIDAGLKHYYMGSWHTPMRGRSLFVNRTFFAGLSTAEQAMVRAAAMQCGMNQMADSLQGGDAILKVWQGLGAVIHESLPRDYLLALRSATDEIYRQWSAAGGPIDPQHAQYAATLEHQRAFMRANQVRWRSGTVDRRFRFNGRVGYQGDLQPNG